MTASAERNSYPVYLIVSASMLLFFTLLGGGLRAEEVAAQAECFTGTVTVQNAPAMGVARITITVEHWTTDQERKKLVEAIHSGGTEALVEAMDDMEAGYIQIENNLRWPLRFASSWTTEKGRLVRFATNRPINFLETRYETRSFDYPIGVAEILLPPEGKAEGALLAATQVEFNADGRLEVKSLPSNMGPQKITNIELETVKPKKSKKK